MISAWQPEGRKADPQTDPPDIVAALDAELALIEALPYRVPIHILAQRARDEIVALRTRLEIIEKSDGRAEG